MVVAAGVSADERADGCGIQHLVVGMGKRVDGKLERCFTEMIKEIIDY